MTLLPLPERTPAPVARALAGRRPLRSLAVGVDGSDGSLEALRSAAALARPNVQRRRDGHQREREECQGKAEECQVTGSGTVADPYQWEPVP